MQLSASGSCVKLGEERDGLLRWSEIPQEVSTAMLRILMG